MLGDAAVRRADTASSRRSLAAGGQTGIGSVGDGLGDLRGEDKNGGWEAGTRPGHPPAGGAATWFGRTGLRLPLPTGSGRGEHAWGGTWTVDAGQPWGIPGCLEQPGTRSQTRKDIEHWTEPNISSLEPSFSLLPFLLLLPFLKSGPSLPKPWPWKGQGADAHLGKITIRTGSNSKQPACFISIYRVHEKQTKTLTAGSNLRGSSRNLPAPLIKAPVWKHNLCLSSSVVRVKGPSVAALKDTDRSECSGRNPPQKSGGWSRRKGLPAETKYSPHLAF